MCISRDELVRIAQLAGLDVWSREEEQLLDHVGQLIMMMDSLEAAGPAAGMPSSAGISRAPLRNDAPVDSGVAKNILANVPELDDSLIRFPRNLPKETDL